MLYIMYLCFDSVLIQPFQYWIQGTNPGDPLNCRSFAPGDSSHGYALLLGFLKPSSHHAHRVMWNTLDKFTLSFRFLPYITYGKPCEKVGETNQATNQGFLHVGTSRNFRFPPTSVLTVQPCSSGRPPRSSKYRASVANWGSTSTWELGIARY